MSFAYFALAAAAAGQVAAQPATHVDPEQARAAGVAQAQAALSGSGQAAPVASATQLTAPQARFIAAGTQVSVAALQEISSKHVKVGDHYQFTVVSDVTDNGVVVIPRGSMATGTISMQTGRAIGGKSGKFDISWDKVEANGVTFPLMGTYRQEGKGNTVGALLGSILISGRSAVMLPGQVVTAMIKEKTAY